MYCAEPPEQSTVVSIRSQQYGQMVCMNSIIATRIRFKMMFPGRMVHGWRWLIAWFSLLAALAAAAEPTIYSGKFEYVVPALILDKMIEFAPIESWKHFPELTRYVDADDDGASDFVAIALGAEGGFGAQIRYRLNHAANGGEAELGPWYWCVITDGSGERIFEQFNP